MAASAHWYGKGLQHALTDLNLSSASVYLMLTTSAYTPDQDAHEFKTSVTNEVTGTGYTAGGKAVTTVSVTYDSVNNRVIYTFDPVTWASSTLTARLGVLYVHTGTDSTSTLLGWLDAGADQVSSAGSLTFTPDANGVLRATAA